jgi:hypothetical protein
MWANSVISKKLHKVNNRPFGRKFAQSGHPDLGGAREKVVCNMNRASKE